MKKIIGIDIGGTKCAVILGELNNNHKLNILDKKTFLTADYVTPDKVLPALLARINELLEKHSLKSGDISSIGISCGGPLNSKSGIIMSPPNLPGWDNVHIVKYFGDSMSIPVFLQNDANACALAEWKFGAGQQTQNMIFLTFGTGLGAGLIIDGRLFSGTNDNAGEVGHIRLDNYGPVGYGKAGSFEGFCSGGGIAQLAIMKAKEKLQMGEKVAFCDGFSGLPEITAQKVAEAALKGDPLAQEIFIISGTSLGKGLSVLIDILNPECIVIGSIFVRVGELLIPSMEKALQIDALPLSRKACRIVPAQLGEQIGDIASLSVALDGFK